MSKDLRWLAEQLQAYQTLLEGRAAYQKWEYECRKETKQLLHQELQFERPPGVWRFNGLVAGALCWIALGCPEDGQSRRPGPLEPPHANRARLTRALMAAGVPRREAAAAGIMGHGLAELDARMSVAGNPLWKKNGCTILEALADALSKLAAPPPKPNEADKHRKKLREQGHRQKEIMKMEGIGESALNKSLLKCREWDEHFGLPTNTKPKGRHRKETLNYATEPWVAPPKIIRSATLPSSKE